MSNTKMYSVRFEAHSFSFLYFKVGSYQCQRFYFHFNVCTIVRFWFKIQSKISNEHCISANIRTFVALSILNRSVFSVPSFICLHYIDLLLWAHIVIKCLTFNWLMFAKWLIDKWIYMAFNKIDLFICHYLYNFLLFYLCISVISVSLFLILLTVLFPTDHFIHRQELIEEKCYIKTDIFEILFHYT